MEVAFHHDDLGAVRGHTLGFVTPLARRLDGRLDGLCASVHGQGTFVAERLAELLEKDAHLVVVERPRRQSQPPRLLP